MIVQGIKLTPTQITMVTALYSRQCYFQLTDKGKSTNYMSRAGLLRFLGGKWSTSRTRSIQALIDNHVVKAQIFDNRVFYSLTSDAHSDLFKVFENISYYRSETLEEVPF